METIFKQENFELFKIIVNANPNFTINDSSLLVRVIRQIRHIKFFNDGYKESEYCVKQLKYIIEHKDFDYTLNSNREFVSEIVGFTNIIRHLIEAGFDMNIKNDNEETFLHYVDNEKDIDRLQKCGVDFNIKDKKGNTPINKLYLKYLDCKDDCIPHPQYNKHQALELFEHLLMGGANPNILNQDGKAIRDLAAKNKENWVFVDLIDKYENEIKAVINVKLGYEEFKYEGNLEDLDKSFLSAFKVLFNHYCKSMPAHK